MKKENIKIFLLCAFLVITGCFDSGDGKGDKDYNAIHFGWQDFEQMPDTVKSQIAELLKKGIYTTEWILNNIIPEGVGSWREEADTILEERLTRPNLTMFAVLPETGETLHWYDDDSWQITGFNFALEGGLEVIVEIAERLLSQGNAQEMTHVTWDGHGPSGTAWEKRAIVFRDDDLQNFQDGPDADAMASAIATGFLTDDGEVYQSLATEPLGKLFDPSSGEEFILWTNGGACEQGVVWNATFYISNGEPFENLQPGVKYYVRFLNPDDAVALENYIEACGYGSRENFDAVPASECP
jgi:hypothetical protein